MPEITIQQSTYERLQRHAKAFVDTPDTVVVRALEALEQTSGQPDHGSGTDRKTERQLDPRALPNLRHTKVLDAAVDGEPAAKLNWNSLVDDVLHLAMGRLGSFEQVRRLCPVNMVSGRKEDEGYSYLPKIDISVQGQDANGACRTLVMAAQGLGIALDVGFMWRLKDTAAHPGDRARLTISGTPPAATAA